MLFGIRLFEHLWGTFKRVGYQYYIKVVILLSLGAIY